MSVSVSDRVYRVVADVFGVSPEGVTDASSPDTIEAWDSVAHINLVLALETEFGVALSPEDSLDMLSVALIKTILAEKGIA